MTKYSFLTDSSLDNRYVFSQSDLETACSQGRLWLVKRCLNSGLIIEADDDKPLLIAIQNGRTAVLQYLLDNGVRVTDEMMYVACQRCNPRIVEILVKYYTNSSSIENKCLTVAVESGCTSTVHVLLKSQANPNINNGQVLIMACQYRLLGIIKLLVMYGADVNVQNGAPLITACETGYADVVQLLIQSGADVNVQNDLALVEASKRNHMRVVVLLLRNGADVDSLRNSVLDDTTILLIDNLSKQLRIPRLKKAIHESFKKQEFKWQEYCATCGTNDYDLFNQAKMFNVDPKGKRKREICAELARKLEYFEKNNYNAFDSLFTDFSGVCINELPFWKIIVIENIPFNCFDLFKLIKQGNLYNPYTKNKLPLDEIRMKEEYLRKILTKEKFRNFNLLQQVRESPILTEEQMLTNRLEVEVWDKMDYPPSLHIIIQASDETIDDMIDKLQILITRRLFGFRLSFSSIYPMITNSSITDIVNSDGLRKKKLFIDLLSNIINYNDIHQDTRAITLAILFKHYSSPNTDNDDFSFMTRDMNMLISEDDYYSDDEDIFNLQD